MHTFPSTWVAGALVALCALASSAQPVSSHRERNGVGWLTGGVGQEERDVMRERASEYNLRVVVAQAGTGEYLATVPIAVDDQNGNPVLNVVSDGPWLFARVQPGRYRIRTGDGQEQWVDVGVSAPVVVYFRSSLE